ncbi:hypothetical protein JAAARDRAFT_36086 [Jaapia argillacea MUCL 33604]|uniref:Uncharacterized protein n=1 Tax=Jaapia argillacea MUCL 33604 TaxID=933084 RepID=A0A067PPA0_9AGAM|nr:hypothetical protein JAAARDRAFT_36086 [Jaapia argillacea MUCL 33604]
MLWDLGHIATSNVEWRQFESMVLSREVDALDWKRVTPDGGVVPPLQDNGLQITEYR